MKAKCGVILLAASLAASPACAERVTIEYEAEAGTVSGFPFGLTVPRLTIVRGYFSYETNTVDLSPADTMRGSFKLAGTWDFRAEFMGKVVLGSGSATASTNLFGSPTLRFEDGKGNAEAPLMSIDGVLDADIGLGFAISGQAKDLPTDQLPARFTFNPPPGGASHTFSLYSNTGAPATTGTMLLQFRSFRQVTLGVQTVQAAGDNTSIAWFSVPGKPYAVEFSTNLVSWVMIRDGITGQAVTTSVVDDLAQRYPTGPLPETGYYRVLDRGPPEVPALAAAATATGQDNGTGQRTAAKTKKAVRPEKKAR